MGWGSMKRLLGLIVISYGVLELEGAWRRVWYCYGVWRRYVLLPPGLRLGTGANDQAYFEAWSFAKSHTLPISNPTETQKALEKFIDNWTCDEFVGFVDHCQEVVDGLELENDQEMSKRCEQVSRLQYRKELGLLCRCSDGSCT
jgi:hypothetical protein